jgi:hypothetical protein
VLLTLFGEAGHKEGTKCLPPVVWSVTSSVLSAETPLQMKTNTRHSNLGKSYWPINFQTELYMLCNNSCNSNVVKGSFKNAIFFVCTFYHILWHNFLGEHP